MSREVVAAVCHRVKEGRLEFLLVRTRDGLYWTFPKGRVEAAEKAWEAAAREAAEEAGVFGDIQRDPFISYLYFKGEITDKVDAYLMAVRSEGGRHEPDRQPQWFTPKVAMEKFAEGGEGESLHEHEKVIEEALRILPAK